MSGAVAVAGGAATLGAPRVSRAQAPISFRFQSTWAAKDIFHEYATDFATKVNAMSGGRLKIDILPAGAVVKAFDLLDTVSKGALDGGHGVLSYWYSKNPAVSLWGCGPAFGMDANMLLAWHEYGGGKALLDEIYRSLRMDVVSFLYGPMPTQPLGWFKKPIAKVEDLKGVRYRTVGLSTDLFSALGASAQALPSADIVPAIDRGALDAGEFNNATSDRALGFPEVSKICMLQSFHQPSEQFEILVNRRKYEALPTELQAVIVNATQACSAQMSWKAVERYSRDFVALQTKDRVQFYTTPRAVLQAQLDAWDKLCAKRAAANPMFKRVMDSQRAYAERAGHWQGLTNVDYRMAYDHYFRKKGA
ncbi:MAG TPA: TRAP transporter substrate-binding protein [Burkholderiales bacterium]